MLIVRYYLYGTKTLFYITYNLFKKFYLICKYMRICNKAKKQVITEIITTNKEKQEGKQTRKKQK